MCATAIKSYTPEDLLTMPDGEAFELVDGNLVERDMGAEACLIAAEFIGLLLSFVKAHKSGWIFTEGVGYQCFPDDPNKVRKPDISFVKAGRFPENRLPQGHIRFAPDLAVEVTSPNDRAYDIDERVRDLLAAGTRLVWVVSPAARTVCVYRPSGPGVTLRQQDELTGDDVLPGFRCRVADLFTLPTASTP